MPPSVKALGTIGFLVALLRLGMTGNANSSPDASRVITSRTDADKVSLLRPSRQLPLMVILSPTLRCCAMTEIGSVA